MKYVRLYAKIANLIKRYEVFWRDYSAIELIDAIRELSPDLTNSDVLYAAEFLYYRLGTYENIMAALNDGLGDELYGELEHVIGSLPAEEDWQL